MTDVGCAGVLVADTFCGPMRTLPAEGELLAVDSMPTKAGGCAANVAIGLAKQGFAVEVAGCVGDDASARTLLACFAEHNVGCQRLVYSQTHPTSKTVILLVDGQDRRYIHSFGANKDFAVGHIDREWLTSLKVFYLGGLFLMPAFQAEELVDLLKLCRRQGTVTVVDVVVHQGFAGAEDLRLLLPWIDYFLPNDDEAEQIAGVCDALGQLRAFLGWGANTVMISRGREGVVAARGERFWRAGIYELPGVVDPSGCGDAFAAGVITGILRGWDVPDTLRYASALGASATQAVGTTDGVYTAAEAESFVASHSLEVHCGRS